MDSTKYIQNMINRARIAQQEFETYSQQQVDKAVKVIGKAIYDHGEELARMAVDETKMGVYEDKIIKCTAKPKLVWKQLKGVKSRGIIKYDEKEGLVEVAKPIGVIGAVTPTTNPVITPVQNAMIALKGGNALIVCPHPRAKNCCVKAVDYMREALEKINYPIDLIQIIPEPTMELSNLVMKMCDTCISTGGPSMVSAAYSSGKPAYGVGAGNVQALIDRDVDLNDVAAMLIKGRTYDNGILCTCEQSAICSKDKYDDFVEIMCQNGAYYVQIPAEIDSLRNILFPGGVLNKDCVGASPVKIASMAGINVPENTKLLLVKVEKAGAQEDFTKEKLCPVLSAFSYDSWEDAVDIANQNLLNEGKGHSVVIHSNTKENVEYASIILPSSRFVVNQVGALALGGAFNNGLMPTTTLGCGSWGNNSTSENLWFWHLINISRIAYIIPDRTLESDEKIWAD